MAGARLGLAAVLLAGCVEAYAQPRPARDAGT
ncbi:MAG: hypothetical protein JWM10_2292, partial [Myxococcaceae bacterium]|nr:hypothetical protein [Myxococcaceae bacterium]